MHPSLQMRTFALCLIIVSTGSFAQITTAKPSDILAAGGFVDVCSDNTKFSKKNSEALKSVRPDEIMAMFQRALDAQLADQTMCLAYLQGVIDGWREGHEHGVI